MNSNQPPPAFRPSGGPPPVPMPAPLAEEQPTRAGATAEACARCLVPFNRDNAPADGSARHENTSFCQFCVTRCQQRQSHLHLCMVCSKR